MAVVDLEHVTRLAETLSPSEKQRLVAHLSRQLQADFPGDPSAAETGEQAGGDWRSKFAGSNESSTTAQELPTGEALPRARIAGLNAGEIWMSDDFNAELPDEFWFGEP
jgi:hypothetical protein